MVKLYDAKYNNEVAVIVDERPQSTWPAGDSVNAMITCNSQMVYVVRISEGEKVKVHMDPLSSENIRFLQELLSSATIRVTFDRKKKPAIVDLSNYWPTDALNEDYH